jgi:hypothetical protein
MIAGLLCAVAVVAIAVASPADAQQINGVPGSPDATTARATDAAVADRSMAS